MSYKNCNLRPKEAAAFLGTSKSTFWRWVQEGKIPKGIRLSTRCTIWPMAILEEFIERKAQES